MSVFKDCFYLKDTLIIVNILFSQLNNPDMGIVIIKDYVKEHFPSTPLLDYALEVEKITKSKVISLSLSLSLSLSPF